jgi:hypothetical protein
MKKVTLLCALLLAVTAGVAAAGPGVNLRWNACIGDGGVTNRNFACNTNAGASNVMVAGFELGSEIVQASGQEIVIDLASTQPTLPAWWSMFQAGTCRQTSLSMNTSISLSAVNCVDWANAQAAGGIGAYNIGQRGPNTSRIKIAIAVPIAALADLLPGQEYFSVNLAINNAKTVGTGACAGCNDGVCLVFNSVKVTTPSPGGIDDRTLTGPANGTDSNFVTWQGGGAVVVGAVSGCPAATPTKNATWSQVKSMYR